MYFGLGSCYQISLKLGFRFLSMQRWVESRSSASRRESLFGADKDKTRPTRVAMTIYNHRRSLSVDAVEPTAVRVTEVMAHKDCCKAPCPRTNSSRFSEKAVPARPVLQTVPHKRHVHEKAHYCIRRPRRR